MITIQEYAKKVDTFLDLWREEMISDIELVECIHRLEADVFIIDGDDQVGYYAVVPSSRIKPRPPQAKDNSSNTLGTYMHGL